MSLKSIVVTVGNTIRIPKGVSFIWANMVAAGGGGGGNAGVGPTSYQAAGKGAGGAGEFYLGVPIAVTPDTFYAVAIGAGGAGGIGVTSVDGVQGTSTSFGGFTALGGFGASSANGQTPGATGGGPNGAVHITGTQTDGSPGTAESPTAFGGPCGGTGEGAGTVQGGAGGSAIGEYPAAATLNTEKHPGGTGGGSVFGDGGPGSTGGDGSDATLYGGGGGGASGTGLGPPERHQLNGGKGAPGIVHIFYIAP